jgi:hypothetical protein
MMTDFGPEALTPDVLDGFSAKMPFANTRIRIVLDPLR